MTVKDRIMKMDHLIGQKETVISQYESELMGKLVLMETEGDGRIRLSKVIKYNDQAVLEQGAITLTRNELAEVVKQALSYDGKI